MIYPLNCECIVQRSILKKCVFDKNHRTLGLPPQNFIFWVILSSGNNEPWLIGTIWYELDYFDYYCTDFTEHGLKIS